VYEAFFNARSQVAADGKRIRDLERQLAELRSERGEREKTIRRAQNEQRRLELRLENELKIQQNLRARAEKAEKRLRLQNARLPESRKPPSGLLWAKSLAKSVLDRLEKLGKR
jgi:chromosome segregation ATPase